METRTLRVLLHPFFFRAEDWNGIDEHLLLLAKHLNRARFELQVLVAPTDGAQTTVLAERAGIRAVRVPYQPGSDLWTRLIGLRKLYAAEHYDIVHMHSPVAGGQAIPALAARLARVRATIATYHQIQPARQPLRTRWINFVTHSHLIDATLAVSRGVRDTLVSAAGLPSQKILTILNGIDSLEETAAPRPPGLPARAPGEVWIGCFGRLSPEKGVTDLLDSLVPLAEISPQAKALIVGDGPSRSELGARVSALGLAERVHFLGWRSDARSIMRHVDIVAHTPVYEGFGLVLLEAMEAGKPVITNDAPGGMTEIVEHEATGLIVPAGSREQLAAALARLVADPEARLRMGVRGHARWKQHFSAEQMSRQVSAVYERHLRRRRQP